MARSPHSTSRTEQLLHGVTLAAVALTVAGLDFLTKWVAGQVLPPGEPVGLIANWFSLRLRTNPNGAFGLFAGLPEESRRVVLLILGVAALLLVLVFCLRFLGWSRWVAVSLGLVLGGAGANWFEQLLYGEVRDFIDLHWGSAGHWPTFNLADVGIAIGSLCLTFAALASLVQGRGTERGGDT